MGKTPEKPEANIQYLHLHEIVRKRPGMYIGGTDERALHQLASHVIDDAVEEALAGHCNQIWITLSKDHQISIRDNGRGIPLDQTSKGKPLLELLMTDAGIRRRDGDYKVVGGYFGELLYAVNALSAKLSVEVAREGYVWRQTYQEGVSQSEVEQVRQLEADESTGKTITFTPDYSILEQNEFSFETLAQQSRELAYVVPGLTVRLNDNRVQPPSEQQYYFPKGLINLIEDINHGKLVLHEPISGSEEWTIILKNKGQRSIGVDFAFQYTDTMITVERGFARTVNTPAGGTHLSGFWSATTDIINHYALQAGAKPFSQKEVAPGLTVVVSIKHSDPSFESQNKIKLLNPEVYGVVAGIIYVKVKEILDKNSDIRDAILQKCAASRRVLESN